jgi:predicted Zn finger-like uncharacterized protein
MDVTCERCGTVYEFDETLVSSRGTAVKCTECDHVFKVLPPDPLATAGAGWHVRRRNGAVDSVASLHALQSRIGRGELSPDEELSRDGQRWKRLADIAELAAFFPDEPAAPAPSRQHQATRMGVGPTTAPSTPPAAPAPGRQRQATRLGVGSTAAPSTPPAAPADETRTSPAPPSDRPPPSGATSRAGDVAPQAPPRRAPKATLLGVGAADTVGAKPGTTRPTDDAPTVPAGLSSPPTQAAFPAGDTSGQATVRARPGASRPPASDPPSGSWTEGPGIPAPAEAEEPRGGPGSSPGRSDPFADTIAAGASGQRISVPTVPGAPRPPPARRERAPLGEAPAPPRRPLYLDAEDELPPLPTRSPPWTWVLLVGLLLAVGGTVAFAWPYLAPLLGFGGPTDPLLPFLDRASTAARQDDPTGYREAIREYTRATALGEDDPRVLLGLAQAHALLAQDLIFQAGDLSARAADDPAQRAEAAAVEREAREHAEEAHRHAERAVRAAPQDARAPLAQADALRLLGRVRDARAVLPDPGAVANGGPAEWHRVAALLAVAAADGDVTAAREEAERAVEMDPDMLRARLLLARALLADRLVAAARAQVEALLGRRPDHSSGMALRAAIERGQPPAPPLVEVLDAGVVAEEDPPGEEPEEPPAGDPALLTDGDDPAPPGATGAGEAAEAGGTGAIPAGRDYGFYVHRAEALLEQGDVGLARRHFEQALQARPGAPEALTGLGFVALDQGDARGAAQRFERAAQGGYADAYIGLGDAYRRLGQPDRALDAYRRYLERHPRGAHASIAQAQVRKLEPKQDAPADAPADAPPQDPPDPSPAGEAGGEAEGE